MTLERATEALKARRAELLAELGARLLATAMMRGSSGSSVAELEAQLDALDELLSSNAHSRAIVASVVRRAALL